MKTNFVRFALCLIGTSMLTGCATEILWKAGDYHPADTPQARLFVAPNKTDVLAQYSEQYRNTDRVIPRAYWVLSNEGRVAAGKKPRFVDPAKCGQLVPLPEPCLENDAGAQPSLSGYFGGEPQRIQLWNNGTELGPFKLPCYAAAPPPYWWRLGLTPVAVVTDAFIVAAAAYGSGAGGL